MKTISPLLGCKKNKTVKFLLGKHTSPLIYLSNFESAEIKVLINCETALLIFL
jgi:hypothetical protein